jgi:hypothetical protein
LYFAPPNLHGNVLVIAHVITSSRDANTCLALAPKSDDIKQLRL